MELVSDSAFRVEEAAPAAVVDNRGMLCAQGILRLMRSMLTVPSEGVVQVLSTDRAAEHDYPVWCQNTGHHFLGHSTEQDASWGSVIVSYIRKRKE